MSGDLDQSFIGFATLADQVHRKSVKRGFDFTLMVVGESGLGKSTLVNSLFLSDLYNDRKMPPVDERLKKTVDIQKTTMEIEEKGVKLRLTVVDTPGFGDNLDGNGSWKACVKYVDDQFAAYFDGESGLNRKNIVDTRVHCCLYFIPPYGHGLRQIDLEFLKRLQYKVNLIPVIAKADTLTKEEVQKLKQNINKEIEDNDIEIYQFPDCDSDEDEEFKGQNQALKSSIPFAVVSGTHSMEIAGRKVRGRQYPWGFVEVDNPKHSDFALLRRFIIQTHMQDLKDVTHDVHYENYRIQCLSHLAGSSGSSVTQEQKSRVKRDSFQIKQESTEKLLHEKDEEIRKMQAMLAQMQMQLKQTNSGAPSLESSTMV